MNQSISLTSTTRLREVLSDLIGELGRAERAESNGTPPNWGAVAAAVETGVYELVPQSEQTEEGHELRAALQGLVNAAQRLLKAVPSEPAFDGPEWTQVVTALGAARQVVPRPEVR